MKNAKQVYLLHIDDNCGITHFLFDNLIALDDYLEGKGKEHMNQVVVSKLKDKLIDRKEQLRTTNHFMNISLSDDNFSLEELEGYQEFHWCLSLEGIIK